MRPFALAVALMLAGTGSAQVPSPQGWPVIATLPPESRLALPPANALAYAELYMPEGPLRAASRRAAREWLTAQMDKSPEVREAQRRYPGIRAPAMAAGLAASDRFDAEEFPRARVEVARFMAARFTPSEIDALVACFATPPARALIKAVIDNFDGHVPGSGPATLEDVRRGVDVAGAAEQVGTEQVAAYTAFDATDVGQKFRGVRRQLQQFVLDQHQTAIRWHNLAVQAAVNEAMRQHIVRAQKGSGK